MQIIQEIVFTFNSTIKVTYPNWYCLLKMSVPQTQVE